MMMRPFLQCGVTAALDGCVAGPAAEWQHFALAVAPMPGTCAALPSVHTAMPTRALWVGAAYVRALQQGRGCALCSLRVPARSTRNIDGICYAKALEPRETVRVRMTNQRKNNYKGD